MSLKHGGKDTTRGTSLKLGTETEKGNSLGLAKGGPRKGSTLAPPKK